MSAIAEWRSWRRTIHDILEMGGDAHPVGYVVNAFIMTLIVLNAIAVGAETVPDRRAPARARRTKTENL